VLDRAEPDLTVPEVVRAPDKLDVGRMARVTVRDG
jgi:hypothetical protein